MLELKNIHKTFNPGTINEKVALNGLNLSLDDGDFATVIGGNGAGRSTMLNAVAGTWMVDEGQILIDGEDVTREAPETQACPIYLGRVLSGSDDRNRRHDGDSGRSGTRQATRQAPSARSRHHKGRAGRILVCLLAPLGLGLETRLTSEVGLLSGGQRQALTLLMATTEKAKASAARRAHGRSATRRPQQRYSI